jgi:hypothetical protein
MPRDHSIRTFSAALAVVLTLSFATLPAAAQGGACYTPQGAERKSILDVLRKPVEDNLRQQVEFVITKLRVCWSGRPSWVFVDAKPQRPGGGPLNWQAAGYEDCSRTVQGLLKIPSVGAGWQVVEAAICPTDVPWAAWTNEYGAPEELFR